ncbi:MAG: hypothetical protein Q8R82_18140 [Hyphomonadaceae bacterium]|nr:hypothetical protein [Hyphomonadaceae bacterium]
MSDPVLDQISEALDLFNAGRRAEARAAFTAIWAEIETEGDPFHHCVLSHYMANTQDDPETELLWNRRALAAADRIVNERPDTASLSVLSLYPSLHLNLADALFRAGDIPAASRHVFLARQASDGIADDAHGKLVRGAIEALAARLPVA